MFGGSGDDSGRDSTVVYECTIWIDPFASEAFHALSRCYFTSLLAYSVDGGVRSRRRCGRGAREMYGSETGSSGIQRLLKLGDADC